MRLKLTILIASIALSGLLRAQQDPHYSQFMYNKLGYNPAYAGSSDKICATLLYRTQWVGFGGGNVDVGGNPSVARGEAPNTYAGNIHAPIGDKFGVGISIYKDQLGFESTINALLSLSYKYTFGDQSILAAGVGLGFLQKNLDGDKLSAIQPGDPLIPKGQVTGFAPDFSGGLYYTMPQLFMVDNFYAGFSMAHLTEPTVRYEGGGGSATPKTVMHYYITTGADYALNSAFTIQPNILVKKDISSWQGDINCFVIWNQSIRGGLTWRTSDAFVILAGYEFPFGMNVGYSYDLTTSDILKYSSGSHEIMLKYCFGFHPKPKEPKLPIPRLTPRFL